MAFHRVACGCDEDLAGEVSGPSISCGAAFNPGVMALIIADTILGLNINIMYNIPKNPIQIILRLHQRVLVDSTALESHQRTNGGTTRHNTLQVEYRMALDRVFRTGAGCSRSGQKVSKPHTWPVYGVLKPP